MKLRYPFGVHEFLVVFAILSFPYSMTQARTGDLSPRRYQFPIDDGTADQALLPQAPALKWLPPSLSEDLATVPEISVGTLSAKHPKGSDGAEEKTAYGLAKINRLNRDDPDGFVKALRLHRPDLHGLPFLMGKDCRTEKEKAAIFKESVAVVRDVIRNIAMQDPEAASVPNADLTATIVNREFLRGMVVKGEATLRGNADPGDVARSDVAGLMQMFAPEPALFRVGLAKHLSTINHVDATKALAKLVLFSPEESVQSAAIAALKNRAAKDYTGILMQGFRYTLPAVSKRAADALVQLKCQDVLADLVAVLDQPDPRAPARQRIDGKETIAVRELVRVNHGRNCVLCHAPGNTPDVPKEVLTVPVPLVLSEPQSYYFRASPDIFVRTDVTYLRQDFSMMMPLPSTEPTKKLARFDFLVRTRVLTENEAAEFGADLAKQGTPPSQRAAQFALRELTGQGPADASAQGWRRLLNLN